MLLILTHENSDFDAIASMLGAYKLFPKGKPLLPRNINRNVQQFLNLYWDVLPFVRISDWRRRRVDEVLLVDTQNLNSVRGMVREPKVRVIDHHMDITPRADWQYQVEAVGATTTLLVERLQATGLMLTSEEATLLLLGIYEDTGSLTYDTSTARDVRAAAWLFEQNAQLDVVRRFLTIPLTNSQQLLYAELQENAQWHRINGQTIVLATAAAPVGFNDEISSVAHRVREILTPSGLFVLVQIGNDVQLVARSSHEYVDVGRIARELGGGGHSRASAALIIGKDLEWVSGRIIELLPQAIEPMARVAEIMSLGVQTVSPSVKVDEAARLMQRTGHEGYPVVDPESGQLRGLLTRRAVDRAMSHNLVDSPISRIMQAGVITVRPSESVERVQELMLVEGWGQIPVIADNAAENELEKPIGIVTRTDLLNYWFRPVDDRDETDIRSLLESNLSLPLWAVVRAASEIAASLTMPLYFVGGLVRDLLLNIPAGDLDMVVEGDAIELIRRLQGDFGGDVHTHARFGTAKWFMSDDVWQAIMHRYGPEDGKISSADSLPKTIDFVTARSEFYTRPSALPEVESGSIKLDLHRRDFTINTLAVRLDGAYLGQLLDFYNGRRDLKRGLIRVLHSLSFIDDPTRILRAVRLEQRLNFSIEQQTKFLLADSLTMLSRVTGDRIRHELELALREADPLKVMERLDNLDVMAHIQDGLKWTPDAADYYLQVPGFLKDPLWGKSIDEDSLEFLYFALWVVPLAEDVQRGTVKRLRGRKTTRDDVLAVCSLLRDFKELPSDPLPNQVYGICRTHSSRVLLAVRIVLGDSQLGTFLDLFTSEWRYVKTSLGGDDLLALGLNPGPNFTILLGKLLDARLNGLVADEAGERAYLADLLANEDGLLSED